MGVGKDAAAPPPPPPPPPDPLAAEPIEPGREVPLRDVVALEEILLEVLVLDRTVELEAAVALGDNAEVELTAVEDPSAALTLLALSGEVEEAALEIPPELDVLNKAFPDDAAAPDPAPDEEPAVLAAADEDELLVAEDWM